MKLRKSKVCVNLTGSKSGLRDEHKLSLSSMLMQLIFENSEHIASPTEKRERGTETIMQVSRNGFLLNKIYIWYKCSNDGIFYAMYWWFETKYHRSFVGFISDFIDTFDIAKQNERIFNKSRYGWNFAHIWKPHSVHTLLLLLTLNPIPNCIHIC